MIYDEDLSYMINHVIYFSLNREMCSYFTKATSLLTSCDPRTVKKVIISIYQHICLRYLLLAICYLIYIDLTSTQIFSIKLATKWLYLK